MYRDFIPGPENALTWDLCPLHLADVLTWEVADASLVNQRSDHP